MPLYIIIGAFFMKKFILLFLIVLKIGCLSFKNVAGEATQVTLEVFNSAGQKVMELVNGQKSAGYHTATFDASGLSSGVYLYKLTTPSFTETKKMLLIK